MVKCLSGFISINGIHLRKPFISDSFRIYRIFWATKKTIIFSHNWIHIFNIYFKRYIESSKFFGVLGRIILIINCLAIPSLEGLQESTFLFFEILLYKLDSTNFDLHPLDRKAFSGSDQL